MSKYSQARKGRNAPKPWVSYYAVYNEGMSNERREFIPPLGDEVHRNGGPTFWWKLFVVCCLVTIPIGCIPLIGYCLWCRWMEKRNGPVRARGKAGSSL